MTPYIFAGNLMLIGFSLLIWDRYKMNIRLDDSIRSLIVIKHSIDNLQKYIGEIEDELEQTKLRNRELSRLIREHKIKQAYNEEE